MLYILDDLYVFTNTLISHYIYCVGDHLYRYQIVAPDLKCHGLTTTTNDMDNSKEVQEGVGGRVRGEGVGGRVWMRGRKAARGVKLVVGSCWWLLVVGGSVVFSLLFYFVGRGHCLLSQQDEESSTHFLTQ